MPVPVKLTDYNQRNEIPSDAILAIEDGGVVGLQGVLGDVGQMPVVSVKPGQLAYQTPSRNIFTPASEDITFVVDGEGSVLTTGSKGYISISDNRTIVGVQLLDDKTGSVVVDILKSSYANFPTTASICGPSKPTLSAARKSLDTILTGWTTAISAGDILEFSIVSVATITRLTICLLCVQA